MMTQFQFVIAIFSLLYVAISGSIYNSVPLSSFSSGPSDGIKITGSSGDQFGYSVASAGDFNNDSIADVVIGARFATPISDRSNAGMVVVLFGHNDSSLDISININTFVTGPLGFKILGPSTSSYLGTSVNGVGDVNGDTIDDILIGAPGANGNTGWAYLIYGRKGSLSQPFVNIDLAATFSSTIGMKIIGPSLYESQFGFSVAGAGDFNEDGFKDIIIGAPYYQNSRGRAYVLMGRASPPVSWSVSNV